MLLRELQEMSQPKTGWCVVSSDGYVVDGPHTSKDEAFGYIRSIAKQDFGSQSGGWRVRYGRRADDGTDEYVATNAVDPTE